MHATFRVWGKQKMRRWLTTLLLNVGATILNGALAFLHWRAGSFGLMGLSLALAGFTLAASLSIYYAAPLIDTLIELVNDQAALIDLLRQRSQTNDNRQPWQSCNGCPHVDWCRQNETCFRYQGVRVPVRRWGRDLQ